MKATKVQISLFGSKLDASNKPAEKSPKKLNLKNNDFNGVRRRTTVFEDINF